MMTNFSEAFDLADLARKISPMPPRDPASMSSAKRHRNSDMRRLPSDECGVSDMSNLCYRSAASAKAMTARERHHQGRPVISSAWGQAALSVILMAQLWCR